VRWAPNENVLWKAEVPGRGHASPVVWQERVFLATADEQAKTQSLLCYDRSTGRKVWETKVHQGDLGRRHAQNTHASATPACDGQKVYTCFECNAGLWVTAVDLEGRIVWQKEAGPYGSGHGLGASPVLY